jgi:N-acetylated-alpha-linked acidic dipeptidase
MQLIWALIVSAMAHFLTFLVAFMQLTKACQRELRNSKDIQHDRHHHFEPRQAESFPPTWTEEERYVHEFFSKVDHDTWASYYTHGDHLAGRTESMAEQTAQMWRNHGIPAITVEYHVLLDYPKIQELVLSWGNGSTYEAQMYEDVLDEDKTSDGLGAVPGFHGYSASGILEAEYVYVG